MENSSNAETYALTSSGYASAAQDAPITLTSGMIESGHWRAEPDELGERLEQRACFGRRAARPSVRAGLYGGAAAAGR